MKTKAFLYTARVFYIVGAVMLIASLGLGMITGSVAASTGGSIDTVNCDCGGRDEPPCCGGHHQPECPPPCCHWECDHHHHCDYDCSECDHPTETVVPTETQSPTETVAPTETVVPTETEAPTETVQPTEEPDYTFVIDEVCSDGTTTWTVRNTNEFSVVIWWGMDMAEENQAVAPGGPVTIEAGATATLTTTTGGPHRIAIFWFQNEVEHSLTDDIPAEFCPVRTEEPEYTFSIDPECDETLGVAPWTVTNTNSFPVDIYWGMDMEVLDINNAIGPVTIAAGATEQITTTSGGPHTLTIFWYQGEVEHNKSYRIEVTFCAVVTDEPTQVPPGGEVTPLEVPVTGNAAVLIPVTGADLTQSNSVNTRGLFFNLGLACFGLGLVFQGIYRKFQS
jgi:hypothetical protein